MNNAAQRRIGAGIAAGALSLTFAVGISPSVVFAQDESGQGTEQDSGQDATDQAVMAALQAAAGHLSAGRYRQAENEYAAVLQMDADNETARTGLERAKALQDQGRILQDAAQDQRVQSERAHVEFDNAMNAAQSQLEQGDYTGARQTVLTARIQLSRSRTVLGEAEFTAMDNRVDALLDLIDDTQAAARLAAEEKKARETREAQQQAELAAKRQRQIIIDGNLRRVRELQMELKYTEALEVIDEILFIDEHNPSALALRDVIMQTEMYLSYLQRQQDKEFGLANLSLEMQNIMVPPSPNIDGPGMRSVSGIVQYPEDWAQLSLLRTNDTGWQESAQNSAVLRRLNDLSFPVNFNNNSLESVVKYVGELTGLQVHVNWKALELINIDRNTGVDLQLDSVPARVALERVLEQLGDDLDQPRWTVQDGIVTITSEDAMRKNTVTIVYDIRDLLFEVPNFDNAPQIDLDQALQQGSDNQNSGGGRGGGGGGGRGGGGGGGGSGGGSGSGIFSDEGGEVTRRSREELVEQIVNLIQEIVDPEGWRDLGGDTGGLQELNGNLIITNTPQNHRDIEGLLSQLREIRALQINVEGRVLEVNTDWFEQIGVDLDLYFNTNNTAFQAARASDPNFILSDFFDSGNGQFKDVVIFDSFNETLFDDGQGNGFANTVASGSQIGLSTDAAGNALSDPTYILTQDLTPVRATSGFTPIGVVQDSLGLTETLGGLTDFGTAVVGAGMPALTTGLSFLDDIQVDLMIKATQADKRSIVLTSPRITFFNGQRANIFIFTQQAYVSGLIPITGDASGAFEPVVDTLNEGFSLDVEGVISADRRYVTMTVAFQLTQNAEFRASESFGGAAGGGGNVGGAAGEFSGTIQLPQITVATVNTTVSVPDKGTILLGGQRISQEIEVESGVPVLSKIPFINRFFTNRITSKEEKTLLILIRPEIIIQQENEDILYPGLSDTMGGF